MLAGPARPVPALRHLRLLAGPGLVGRRVEVRVTEREVLAVALDTGELACRHQRSFARHRTITAFEHARALSAQRGQAPTSRPTVEIRPLCPLRRADRMSRPTTELAHLFRQLKAPAAARALPKLADRAREEEWSYEQFAAVLLKTETDSRDSHGGQARIKAARFPARKTIEEFDFAFQASIRREHRPAPRPARLPRRPRERRPARPARHRQDPPRDRPRASAPASPATASRSAPPPNGSPCSPTPNATAASTTELDSSQRIPLLIVDEVGYIPFDPHAANLMFMLVSRRYERASLIVTPTSRSRPGARSSATRSPPPP